MESHYNIHITLVNSMQAFLVHCSVISQRVIPECEIGNISPIYSARTALYVVAKPLEPDRYFTNS